MSQRSVMADRRPRLALLCVGVALLAGCGQYVLRGKVVSGPRSAVLTVDEGSPEMAGPAIERAAVRLVLDPHSGGRQNLGTVFTDETGRFEMSIEAFGAGTLEYELLVTARHPKHSPANQIIDLPGRGKRVLVRLAEGRDRPVDPDGWRTGLEGLDNLDDGGWDRARQARPD